MTAEYIERLLSDLCYFSKVDITHTFSFKGDPFLQVKCITVNSRNILEFTYLNNNKVEHYSDIEHAANVITNIISKETPV